MLWTALKAVGWKALAWLLPGGSILSAIATVAGALLGFLVALVKTACKGAAKMLANPATLVTAGLCVLAGYGLGIGTGKKWDAHLVRKAVQQLDVARKQLDATRVDLAASKTQLEEWKGRLNAQESRAHEAEVARAEAEKAADAALARMRRAERLRNNQGGAGTKGAGSKGAAGSGLPSLPALFGISQ